MTIRDIRDRTGLSQSKFAAKFGIPVNTIQTWEAGNSEPRPYILFMMSRILELEELHDGVEQNE